MHSLLYTLIRLTCCAGEVGYMAGPINTCWMVYTEGKIVKSAEVPIWTLIIGTVSMLAGLIFIGYKMIIAMVSHAVLHGSVVGKAHTQVHNALGYL
jgi:phosphate/sulfate permease